MKTSIIGLGNVGATIAYILGEHGETQFPVLSNASAGGVKLGDEAESGMVFKKSAHSGWEIIRGKGYSNFAISMATALIVESIYLDNLRTIPISTLINGYQDVQDVCLSVPVVVGATGIVKILKPELNPEETEAFRQSAQAVKEAIEGLKYVLHRSQQKLHRKPDLPSQTGVNN